MKLNKEFEIDPHYYAQFIFEPKEFKGEVFLFSKRYLYSYLYTTNHNSLHSTYYYKK